MGKKTSQNLPESSASVYLFTITNIDLRYCTPQGEEKVALWRGPLRFPWFLLHPSHPSRPRCNNKPAKERSLLVGISGRLYLNIFISYVCMYVCMYVCTYVCMYVCMHACMYVDGWMDGWIDRSLDRYMQVLSYTKTLSKVFTA